jgi:hypothetical protein
MIVISFPLSRDRRGLIPSFIPKNSHESRGNSRKEFFEFFEGQSRIFEN